jgi:hypothetical protein
MHSDFADFAHSDFAHSMGGLLTDAAARLS